MHNSRRRQDCDNRYVSEWARCEGNFEHNEKTDQSPQQRPISTPKIDNTSSFWHVRVEKMTHDSPLGVFAEPHFTLVVVVVVIAQLHLIARVPTETPLHLHSSGRKSHNSFVPSSDAMNVSPSSSLLLTLAMSFLPVPLTCAILDCL